MIKEYTHICHGTCSRQMTLKYDTDTNKLIDFVVVGGCQGNLRGIRQLIIGMDLDEIHDKLIGTDCGGKGTSCPDQIALAIEELKK
ncbi:MAG: TIGR03905 family TSCPD domain-containing protein [Bacilli bacterium]